jgi:hypothetical protein
VRVTTKEGSGYSIDGFLGFERGWCRVTGIPALFCRWELDSCILVHKKEATVRNGEEGNNKP